MSVKAALRYVQYGAPLLVVGLLFAPGACTADTDDEYHGAKITFHNSGRVDCTPAESERTRHDSAVAGLRLNAEEAIRLCVLTSGVRHAQWIAIRGKRSEARERMREAITTEIDRALPANFRDEKIPGVRAYLRAE